MDLGKGTMASNTGTVMKNSKTGPFRLEKVFLKVKRRQNRRGPLVIFLECRADLEKQKEGPFDTSRFANKDI